MDRCRCEDCGTYVNDSEIADVNGKSVCTDCLENYVCCTECDEYHELDDVRMTDDGEPYCIECFDALYVVCSDCDKVMDIDTVLSDGICADCATDRMVTTC